MEILIISTIFLLGLIVGSFLNAWIYRMKHGEKVSRGRSKCPKCGHALSWNDLIPVLSFIILKGRCRYCKKKIDIQYPLVELATGALFTLTYIILVNKFLNFSLFIFHFSLAKYWYFISILITIFVYDLRYKIIPDRVTLPAIGIGIVLQLLMNAAGYQLPAASFFINQLLLPIIIGGGFFLTQFIISRGRWIGGGDIRLGALMGVILGWPNVLIGLMLAYFIGAIVSIGLLIAKKVGPKSQIAFGTFLSAATIITMFLGNEIVNAFTSTI